MPRSPQGRRALRAQVARELRSLGDTDEQIAQRLEAAGVRGMPGKVADCALAVYLSAVLAADARVRAVHVSPPGVFVEVGDRWRPLVGVPLTTPLCSFIWHFDRRCYPGLVRHGADDDRDAEGATRTPEMARAPRPLALA